MSRIVKYGVFQRISVFFFALSISSLCSGRAIIYVNASSASGGNGSSWANAYRDLNDALVFAQPGIQIWVARGRYVPASGGASGPDDFAQREKSFMLSSGAEVYGGFAGNESTLAQRDPVANPTVLSGDLGGNDLDFGDRSENSFHVIRATGLQTIILDGFVITGGNADRSSVATTNEFRFGGGLFSIGRSILIRDCHFVDNNAMRSGGGIWSREVMRIENCRFSGNHADDSGGAIRYLASADLDRVYGLEIINCEFDGNAASQWGGALLAGGSLNVESSIFTNNYASTAGGAIDLRQGDITIESSQFVSNRTGGGGGALSAQEGGSVNLMNCRFERNSALVGGGMVLTDLETIGGACFLTDCEIVENVSQFIGGGFVIASRDVMMKNCRIEKNTSNSWGGGGFLSARDNEILTVRNCIFNENNVKGLGGGIYLDMSETSSQPVVFTNCTFNENCGSGLVTFDAITTLQNSIFWGNVPEQIFDDNSGEPPLPPSKGLATLSRVEVHNSDVQGGWFGPGDNNIDADPLFVQPLIGDLRLGFRSPCLDAGRNDFLPGTLLGDIDGNDRVANGIVDMGALEGPFVRLPQSIDAMDILPEQSVILFHNPCGFESIASQPTIIFHNKSTSDVATASMEELSDSADSNAGGFSELGTILQLDTNLDDGQYEDLVIIPFHNSLLRGRDPMDIDLTFFDSATGLWVLAAERNTRSSPGHPTSLGDRTAFTGENLAIGPDLGDYGVFYNPVIDSGVVWARLDYPGRFGLGFAICDGDIVPIDGINGLVDINDLLFLLEHWGALGGLADVFPGEGDGVVNVSDLLLVLTTWGECP